MLPKKKSHKKHKKKLHLSESHLATSSTSFLYDDCRPQKDAKASSCSRLGVDMGWPVTPLKTNMEADWLMILQKGHCGIDQLSTLAVIFCKKKSIQVTRHDAGVALRSLRFATSRWLPAVVLVKPGIFGHVEFKDSRQFGVDFTSACFWLHSCCWGREGKVVARLSGRLLWLCYRLIFGVFGSCWFH